MNEFVIHSLTQFAKSTKPKYSSFNIMDDIEYIFNLYSAKAVEKEIELVLRKEPGFPLEVDGFKTEFELIFSSILNFLIQNLSKTELKLYTKFKNRFGEKFNLDFEFEFPSKNYLSAQELECLLKLPQMPKPDSKKSNFTITQAIKLVEYLDGKFHISEFNNSSIKISIELLFSVVDSSKEIKTNPKINAYRIERSGEFIKKWTNTIGPSDINVSPKYKHLNKPKLFRATTEKALEYSDIFMNKAKEILEKVKKRSTSNNEHITNTPSSNPSKHNNLSLIDDNKNQEMIINLMSINESQPKISSAVPVLDMGNNTAEEKKTFTFLDNCVDTNKNENNINNSSNFLDKFDLEYYFHY